MTKKIVKPHQFSNIRKGANPDKLVGVFRMTVSDFAALDVLVKAGEQMIPLIKQFMKGEKWRVFREDIEKAIEHMKEFGEE